MNLKSFYTKRLDRIQNKLKLGEALFLNKKSDVTYLTGFKGEDSFVFLTDSHLIFITDGRYVQEAKEEIVVDYELKKIQHDCPLEKILSDLISDFSVKTLLVRRDEVSLALYELINNLCEGLAWESGAELMDQLRMRKDAYELEIIRQNLLITELGFHYAVRKFDEVRTELELAAELEYFLKKKGAEAMSFETIVASGTRSALPHGTASSATLDSESLLLMDFGILKDSYCSDFTRCHYFDKITNPKILEVQSIVKEAALAAESVIRPGLKASALDAVARKVIEQAGYGEFFIHSLGHGVGLDIHEEPRISPSSKTILKSGMVFTVEPGIYLPGEFGIRLEDMVVVTPEGCEVLTQCYYDL